MDSTGQLCLVHKSKKVDSDGTEVEKRRVEVGLRDIERRIRISRDLA